MGLHSPFGYVDYEVPLAHLFIDILDKLCAHCHTDGDYRRGCRECPAGVLVFECRDYLTNPNDSDKRFELYASDEWAKKSNRVISVEERQKDLEMAEDYKPECGVLRDMGKKAKIIKPHPFFYVRDGKKGWRRPKPLNDLAELVEDYAKKKKARMCKWGLGALANV